MKIGPIFPIFGEEFSFPEDFAATFRDFPRQSLRDQGAAAPTCAYSWLVAAGRYLIDDGLGFLQGQPGEGPVFFDRLDLPAR
jgi:hypothetical protein